MVSCTCTTCTGNNIDAFKLTYAGQTTAIILADADTAAVDSALEVRAVLRIFLLRIKMLSVLRGDV